LDRAQDFARRHGIARAYASYEELVSDDEVEAIYVASPHSLHLEHALLAIEAGKHVLIEKPIAVNAAQAESIYAAAEANNVTAMEAMWVAFLPQEFVIRNAIADGLIGPVTHVFANFAAAVPYDPTSRLFDPDLAGGALLDIGVYVASLATRILGPARQVYASGSRMRDGVDLEASIVMQAESGGHALLATGFTASLPAEAHVVGTHGRLTIGSPFWYANTVDAFDERGQGTGSWCGPSESTADGGMAYELAHFADVVGSADVKAQAVSKVAVLETMSILDSARSQLHEVPTPNQP
jgi:predicted dehydrogenase